jgi:cytochrome c biogenesis protein CcmG/thiol:disulfide interchange protein DsbE
MRMRTNPVTFVLIAAILLIVTTNFSSCHSGSASTGASGTAVTDAKGNKPAAPDVTFKDLDNKDVTLASYKGKVVILNFWATWCDPCREEIPWFIEFQQKYADKGFTLLGVAMDEEGKPVVQPFVQTTPFNVNGHPNTMNYPIVIGNDDIASKFGGLLGLPTTIVISRDGKIQKRYIGSVDKAALEKDIQALLDAPQTGETHGQ